MIDFKRRDNGLHATLDATLDDGSTFHLETYDDFYSFMWTGAIDLSATLPVFAKYYNHAALVQSHCDLPGGFSWSGDETTWRVGLESTPSTKQFEFLVNETPLDYEFFRVDLFGLDYVSRESKDFLTLAFNAPSAMTRNQTWISTMCNRFNFDEICALVDATGTTSVRDSVAEVLRGWLPDMARFDDRPMFVGEADAAGYTWNLDFDDAEFSWTEWNHTNRVKYALWTPRESATSYLANRPNPDFDVEEVLFDDSANELVWCHSNGMSTTFTHSEIGLSITTEFLSDENIAQIIQQTGVEPVSKCAVRLVDRAVGQYGRALDRSFSFYPTLPSLRLQPVESQFDPRDLIARDQLDPGDITVAADGSVTTHISLSIRVLSDEDERIERLIKENRVQHSNQSHARRQDAFKLLCEAVVVRKVLEGVKFDGANYRPSDVLPGFKKANGNFQTLLDERNSRLRMSSYKNEVDNFLSSLEEETGRKYSVDEFNGLVDDFASEVRMLGSGNSHDPVVVFAALDLRLWLDSSFETALKPSKFAKQLSHGDKFDLEGVTLRLI